MSITTIRSRIEAKEKQEANRVLNNIGLTLSEAIRLFLRQVILQHGIPFELKVPPIVPNQETIEAIEEARRGNLKSVKTIEQFKEAMNARD